ncbi:OmpA family protein [Marinifilum flexuosum]|uniref:OmpA family protein n=1 Tax=Marinifilum flexuosum TaxID=1117708 RepID=A0A419X788_9BACT|nr:OmpA family protein [Marinifilum flexuosum]RKE03634.1 OmpA family protein [Marinifilum flexuosum]
MKKLVLITLLLTISISIINAQILDPKKVAKKQGTKRANNKIEKSVDKGFDKLEEGIGSLFGKKKKKKKSKGNSTKNTETSSNQPNTQSQYANDSDLTKEKESNVVWSRFDFVPGDEVIFSDGPDIMEENGEFPSRWDLYEGGAEIANVDGANVILFITASGNMYRKGIIPYLKNPKEDYLPEVFTIEFDGYFNPDVYNESFHITLYDRKNQSRNNIPQIDIGVNEAEMGNSSAKLEGKRGNKDDVAGWRHISIAYTKGKAKVYLDETRLINIPRIEGNPTGITLSASQKNMFVKNFRVAKGGVKYYDRVIQDGKIICNGIRFDVGKATLKPESMGPINKIYDLMTKQPDLKFSVEGHTDADGDDAKNQMLSEQRAKTVMEQLISMGIAANRFNSKGFGESMPLDNNRTPEGKANNRRVEFVKFDGNASSFGPKPANNRGNSAYAKINAVSIDKEFDKLSDEFHTPISGPNGIVNGAGTIFLVFTSAKNLCKLEILDVDKNDNYKTTIKYATYNRSGETVSQSDHIEIEGTFPVDLDKGNAKDPARADWDLILKRSSDTNASFGLGGENIVIRKYE